MTNNELDIPQDGGRLEVLPPAHPPMQSALAVLRAHADMMEMAYQLAVPLCKTSMVPLRFRDKPQEATAVMLYGAELGLSPIQSLQLVINIHGTPALAARTQVALLQDRGYIIRTHRSSDDEAEVWGWRPGRNPDRDPPDAKSYWDMAKAVKRDYVPRPSSDKSLKRPWVLDDWETKTNDYGKKSIVNNIKYVTHPEEMLLSKAQAVVCRTLAPEVLLGLSSEEFVSASAPRDDDPAPRVAAAWSLTADDIITETDAPSPQQPDVPTEPPAEPAPKRRPAPAPSRVDAARQEQPSLDEPGLDEPGPQVLATEPANPVDEPDRNELPQESTRRLFALLRKAGYDASTAHRENRMRLFRYFTGRPEISSTVHLTKPELDDIIAQLTVWEKKRTLPDEVAKILLAIAADEQEESKA